MDDNINPIEDILPFEALEFPTSLNFSQRAHNLGYATKRFDVTRKVGDRYKVEYVERGELVNSEESNRYSDFNKCTIPAVSPQEAYGWFNAEGFLNLRINETIGNNDEVKCFVQVIVQNGALIVMESVVKNSASEAIASKRIPY